VSFGLINSNNLKVVGGMWGRLFAGKYNTHAPSVITFLQDIVLLGSRGVPFELSLRSSEILIAHFMQKRTPHFEI
jgi:hypothetical protein